MAGDVNFGPAQECLSDLLKRFPGIEDDCSDLNVSYGAVAVRRLGRSEVVDSPVSDHEIHELGSLMASALDLEISARTPILEKRLPPRYRVTISHPSVTQDGHWNCSIRFLPTTIIPLSQYVSDSFMDQETAESLCRLASTRNTMLIAGATGAGKTTMMRSILAEIPERDRIIVIESGAELNIERPNMAALEDTDDASFETLIAHCLRLDPDIIVVGEVRGREASRFITIAAAGHPCMTTLHAEGKDKALLRLHRMVRLSEPHFDREELEGAIDAVAHIRLDPESGKRRVELWQPKVIELPKRRRQRAKAA